MIDEINANNTNKSPIAIEKPENRLE